MFSDSRTACPLTLTVQLFTDPEQWNYDHTIKGCRGWKVTHLGKQFGAFAWGAPMPKRVILEDIKLYLETMGQPMPEKIEWITSP